VEVLVVVLASFSLAETLLFHVIDTLCPTLNSSNRFALGGTSTASNLLSAVLMLTTRFSLAMVSTVPERLTFCVGTFWSAAPSW
jgi:hypothetical protein